VICAIHNAYYWLNKSLIRSGYHGYAMDRAYVCAMNVRGLVLLFVSHGIALKSIVEVALTVRLSEGCRLRNIM
jgi:hypothetical protein